MKKILLDDGLEVYGYSKYETRIVHREVFTVDMYRKEGIQVSDGDCVFDVGANIGLFLISLSRTLRDLRLFAFEPIPSTFQKLELNCRDHLPQSRVRLFNIGLADSPRMQEMCFDGVISAGSSLYINELDSSVSVKLGARAWVKAIIGDLRDVKMIREGFASGMNKAIDNRLLRPFALFPWLVCIGIVALWRKLALRKITCELKTLSNMINETGTEKIDLLKIDVEGAELDVVRGIEDKDFKKIRQMVIEVHNFGNHTGQIMEILEKNGFKVTEREGDWETHRMLGISTIYARSKTM